MGVTHDDEGSRKREGRLSSLAQGRRVREKGGGEQRQGRGACGVGGVPEQLWLTPLCVCSLAADLAECKLVSFPIGIYKVLRNVTDQIHLITLANNELKSLTSKFMTTFCQLRGTIRSAQAGRAWTALGLRAPALCGQCPQGPESGQLDSGNHFQGRLQGCTCVLPAAWRSLRVTPPSKLVVSQIE